MRLVRLCLSGWLYEFAKCDVCKDVALHAGLNVDDTFCNADGICENILRASQPDEQLIDVVRSGGEPISCDEAAQWLASDRRFKRRISLEETDSRNVRPADDVPTVDSMTDLIRDVLLPKVEGYPFASVGMFKDMEENIMSGLEVVAPHLRTSRELNALLLRLVNAARIMLASFGNDPGGSWSSVNVNFVSSTVRVTSKLYAALGNAGSSFTDALGPSVGLVFEGLPYVRAQLPSARTVAENLLAQLKCNESACAMCSGARPLNVMELGDRLLACPPTNAIRIHFLAYLNIICTAIGEYAWTGQRGELAYVFQPENRERICSVHFAHLFNSFGRRVMEAVPEFDDDQHHSTLRRSLLRWIRLCAHKVDSRLVLEIVHYLLQRSVMRVVGDPQVPSLLIDQARTPREQLDSVFLQMAGLERRDLVHEGPSIIEVTYLGSTSYGSGNVKHLIDLVVEHVVDPTYGLFLPTYQGSPAAVPNPSATNDSALAKFRSLGQLMGMAYSLGIVLGLPLGQSVLGLMRSIRPGFISLDEIMVFLRKPGVSLEKFQEHYKSDYPEKVAFITSGNISGMRYDLQPDRVVSGDTPEERRSYLMDQMLSDRVVAIYPQVSAMVMGFYDVAPFPLLSYYDMDQLTALLSARNTVIDRIALRRSASYSDGISEEVISWFWDIIENDLNDKQMAGFLKFVSGSKYPPMGGFTGMNGDKMWLSITYDSEEEDWPPVAQTCFNSIHLTRYSSREILKDLILLVVSYDGMDND